MSLILNGTVLSHFLVKIGDERAELGTHRPSRQGRRFANTSNIAFHSMELELADSRYETTDFNTTT